jgi:hypothetical protein
MTKRSLYASATRTLQAVGLWLAVVAAPAAAQPAPCPGCVLPEVTPALAGLFPAEFHGLGVLVRVPAGAERSALPPLELIAARGGIPGLVVEGLSGPLPDASVLSRARFVVVDVTRVAAANARLAFTLRQLLTRMRAAAPAEARFGVAAQAPVLARIEEELAPYVDFFASETADASRTRSPRWRIVAAADVRAVLDETRTTGAARWVWRLPEDPEDAARLLRELAAAAAPDQFAQDVEVVGARRLTVEEIVARHQAAAARQNAAVTTLISTGSLAITFDAPGFSAPVTVASETIVYTSRGQTDVEQRNVRVNGLDFNARSLPRLPIIEPERAAAPPLAITLTNVYRYRLAGEETVDGVRSYVVAFVPADDAANLFRGRAWIAADSFAMVKVAATQTGLRGAIVSSEQIDEFRPHGPGLWLLARSETRQLYEGAAHRTPITRLLVLSRHEVNPPDFEARLAAAHASANLMLRDTPAGYRYLTRQPGGGTDVVERTVADRASRVRTIAAGVIIDPNISTPLPFAGLSYLDFDLLGTGAQLSVFFGGSYGQLAFSVPSLRRSRWQIAGRAFGIATSFNDRAFAEGREIYERNIRQRPAHASVWIVRPLGTRMAVRAAYEMDYTHFARAPETAAAFVVPQSQLVHGARLAIDIQQGGWAGSAWWNPARRHAWRAWGATDAPEYAESHRDFQRFGASLTRSTVVSPRVVTKIEAAWMSGTDLDRFSRYAFGTFDNRLRGYPSALIRYDRGGVVRGAIAWTAGRLLRVDGFADTAVVRDAGFGRGFRNYTGVGAAVEGPAPFGTLLAVEWGYGFRGVNSNGRRGTHVVRVSAFKIF